MTGIDYLPAQLAGLATSLRMMGSDNSADIAQRGAERVEQQARELEELRSAARAHLQAVVEHDCQLDVVGAQQDRVKAAESRLRALVAPSVPETEETTDAD